MGFRLERVALGYPGARPALSGIDLAARPGERIALIGPSGAGKSTLLRALGLGLRPAAGALRVLDEAPWKLPARELRCLRARIGLLHQAPALPPRQRVVHAVLAGRLGRWPWWKSLASLLRPVDVPGAAAQLARLGLDGHLFERCDHLSGGQLQRVALARLLYQAPQLMLADEPVSAMDPALARSVVELLGEEAQRRGATLVASLHSVDLALRHFPRIVGIRAGRVLFDLAPEELGDALLAELYAPERERRAAERGATPAVPSARFACR